MFTAASASVVYLSFGGIPFDYSVVAFLVGLIFTMIGQARAATLLSSSYSTLTYALCRTSIMPCLMLFH
jgi:hypothetical protein